MRRLLCDGCDRHIAHGESFLRLETSELVAREGRSSAKVADTSGLREVPIDLCIHCITKPLVLAVVVGKRMRDLDAPASAPAPVDAQASLRRLATAVKT